jgi:hypothetical protein
MKIAGKVDDARAPGAPAQLPDRGVALLQAVEFAIRRVQRRKLIEVQAALWTSGPNRDRELGAGIDLARRNFDRTGGAAVRVLMADGSPCQEK